MGVSEIALKRPLGAGHKDGCHNVSTTISNDTMVNLSQDLSTESLTSSGTALNLPNLIAYAYLMGGSDTKVKHKELLINQDLNIQIM